MRADERAVEERIRRNQETENRIHGGIKTAAGIGMGLAGAGVASRLLPFLSEHIPLQLAMKGISAISPQIGKFLAKGQAMGLDIKEGMDFVKGKMTPKEESENTSAKENRNIIEQYSPELHAFIDQAVKQGVPVISAGYQATQNPKFKDAIFKLTKDHKMDWSTILQNVYGGGQTAQPRQQPQQSQQQQGQNPDAKNQLMQAMQQLSQILKS